MESDPKQETPQKNAMPLEKGNPQLLASKRAREPDGDAILDNYHSHKRYLTEVMASSLNGLRVGEGPGRPMSSPSSMTDLVHSPTQADTASISARDDFSNLDSAMSDDSDDSVSVCRAPDHHFQALHHHYTLNNNHSPASSSDSQRPSPFIMNAADRLHRACAAPGELPDTACTCNPPSPVSPRRRTILMPPSGAAPMCVATSPPRTGSNSFAFPIPPRSHSKYLADVEGRLPPSPSDPSQSANLRRAALLRAIHIRTQGPAGAPGASPISLSPPKSATCAIHSSPAGAQPLPSLGCQANLRSFPLLPPAFHRQGGTSLEDTGSSFGPGAVAAPESEAPVQTAGEPAEAPEAVVRASSEQDVPPALLFPRPRLNPRMVVHGNLSRGLLQSGRSVFLPARHLDVQAGNPAGAVTCGDMELAGDDKPRITGERVDKEGAGGFMFSVEEKQGSRPDWHRVNDIPRWLPPLGNGVGAHDGTDPQPRNESPPPLLFQDVLRSGDGASPMSREDSVTVGGMADGAASRCLDLEGTSQGLFGPRPEPRVVAYLARGRSAFEDLSPGLLGPHFDAAGPASLGYYPTAAAAGRTQRKESTVMEHNELAPEQIGESKEEREGETGNRVGRGLDGVPAGLNPSSLGGGVAAQTFRRPTIEIRDNDECPADSSPDSMDASSPCPSSLAL